ncbi:hypothetical protein ALP26_100095 [Pseudomonas savastanoi pv. glycinea]|uniref:DUF3509 domain-containing protein n=17 Tax=Pseudomonas syringae group TaxID=136849 RepID=A0A0Q0C1S6_PSEAJ|nr:Uncharacterized protein ALO82_01551 [Pseudomonas syringae pv. broussonetiae]KPX02538.1 Uncharacterized protein ALO74_03605 [Pseudomonas syringae pv. cunninghamiae]KPX12989.1 Uncharacterized protein ALO73_00078 [Pseudomonas syringae pv. daphniphylli]KPX15372.1 Uncharacterized protein ALO71_02597 [Pseudomonas amygdali pv. dendropanacis]KPX31802.1 Uncharacterized protein ALO69_00239 [Pseudomonas ficuserectae]KPX41571.1 hypothetical protein ALO37_100041 [Pseudomonas savastanoi pv. glycinea]KPX
MVIRMENISLLLSEALAPYQATIGPAGTRGERLVTLKDKAGVCVIERTFGADQLSDKRQLTDVVDGLRRDLMVAEGRIEPCVIAAMRNAAISRTFIGTPSFA